MSTGHGMTPARARGDAARADEVSALDCGAHLTASVQEIDPDRPLAAKRLVVALPSVRCPSPALFALQELGGWASTEMVRRYAHLSADHRRLMLNASVRYEPWKKPKAQIRYRPEKGKGSHRCKLLIYWLRGPAA